MLLLFIIRLKSVLAEHLGDLFNVKDKVQKRSWSAWEQRREPLQHRPAAAGMAAEISGGDATPPTTLHAAHQGMKGNSLCAPQPPPARDTLSRVTITPSLFQEERLRAEVSGKVLLFQRAALQNDTHAKSHLSPTPPPPAPYSSSSDGSNTTQSCKFRGALVGSRGQKNNTVTERLDGRLDTTHFCCISKNPKLVCNYSEASPPSKGAQNH